MISVLMGVYYRGEDLEPLRKSVGSILNQSFTDFEFLICDDGSTEAAGKLLEEMGRSDARIRLIRKGNLSSLPRKLNACLAEAAGEYFARMDDDDVSHDDRFDKQLAALRSMPDIAFVGSCVELRRAGKKAGYRRLPEFPQIKDFYFTQPYIHPALMFRSEALTAVNGYSEDKRCILCEDYDLLLRLYAKGFRGMNLQEALLDYTVPVTAKGGRKMRHRWNEAVTRWRRFRELGVLPGALPYVVKPLAVGLVPEPLLSRMKNGMGKQRE